MMFDETLDIKRLKKFVFCLKALLTRLISLTSCEIWSMTLIKDTSYWSQLQLAKARLFLPCGHHVVYRWTPHSLHVDSTWFPGGNYIWN